MTNDEVLNRIAQALGTIATPPAAPPPVTKIDQVIPLPIGSKTITGFLVALISGATAVVAANPNILDVSHDWKPAAASGVALLFTSLMGAGGIAKWQRQILISQQAVDVLQQVLKKLSQPTDV